MSPSRTSARALALAAPLLAALLTVVAPAAHAALGTAVEFYEPVLRHYFMTAYPDEAAMLDGGQVVKGWKRTGGEFTIHTDPAPDRLPVCRFYGAPGSGLQTHFYTANPAECEWVKTLPKWKFEAIAFYIQVPTAGACPYFTTPVYRSFFSDQISDVNHRFSVDLTVAARQPLKAGWVSEGIVMCSPLSDADLHADAVRLLEQGALGPDRSVGARGQGQRAADVDQRAARPQRHALHAVPFWKQPADGRECRTTGRRRSRPRSIAIRGSEPAAGGVRVLPPVENRARPAAAAHGARLAPDLRINQSGGLFGPYAFAEFHQRLRDHAFGTFENLLLKYALSPHLGLFQNWAKNVPERERHPSQRKFRARADADLHDRRRHAERRRDAEARRGRASRSRSYGQADIETLARILTGYTFPTKPGNTPEFWENNHYFIGDMIPYNAPLHDDGYKNLLNGRLILYSGGRRGERGPRRDPDARRPPEHAGVHQQAADPEDGHELAHAGLRQARRRRVPQQRLRLRGDLASVTRAILLDPEARGARKIDRRVRTAARAGPVLDRDDPRARRRRPTAGTRTPLPRGRASSISSMHRPCSTITRPITCCPGTGFPAPEFGIFTSAEILNRANQVNDLLYSVDHALDRAMVGPATLDGAVPLGTPSPTMAAFLADAGNPEALVTRMDRLLLHGTMTAPMRKVIVNAINKVPPRTRRRAA